MRETLVQWFSVLLCVIPDLLFPSMALLHPIWKLDTGTKNNDTSPDKYYYFIYSIVQQTLHHSLNAQSFFVKFNDHEIHQYG